MKNKNKREEYYKKRKRMKSKRETPKKGIKKEKDIQKILLKLRYTRKAGKKNINKL